jgi:hypothetical protein
MEVRELGTCLTFKTLSRRAIDSPSCTYLLLYIDMDRWRLEGQVV